MRFFQGLPIPLAAGVVMSVILANNGQPITAQGASSFTILVLVISYLMVSNVRYRTFKKLGSKRKAALLAVSVVSAFVVLSRLFQPGMALAMVMAGYVGLGLVEEVLFFRARNLEEVDAEEDEKLA